MILIFSDNDGDEVAVESATIVGLSIGALNGPKPAEAADVRVTLVWCAGVPAPFMVGAPFAEVLEAWQAARVAGPPPDLKGSHGWPVNWLDPALKLPGSAPWAAMSGGPK